MTKYAQKNDSDYDENEINEIDFRIDDSRKLLPIYKLKDELIKMINDNQILVRG